MKLAPSGPTLIVQPLPGIGDMVWHLPHIHAIAATTIADKVDILTKPRSQADRLLRADPQVGQILWLERESGRHAGVGGVLRLATALRQGGYQRVWILHGSARYALAARLAGISERLGYGVGLQSLLLTVPVRLPPEGAAHPIPTGGCPAGGAGYRPCRTGTATRTRRRGRSGGGGTVRDWPTPWIALGVGSSETWKQWGAARFAELILALNQRRAGSIFIVGGSGGTAAGGRYFGAGA